MTFSVEATGYITGYQWQCNNDGYWYDIYNYDCEQYEREPSLSAVLGTSNHGWKCRCVITDINGETITSNVVTIKLAPNPLTITKQPESYVGADGDDALFVVEAGGYDVRYRWQVYNDSWGYWIDEDNYGNTISVTLSTGTQGNRYRFVINDFEGNEVVSDEVTISMA